MFQKIKYRSKPRSRHPSGGRPSYSELTSGSAYEGDLEQANAAADEAARDEDHEQEFEDGSDRNYMVGHHTERDCAPFRDMMLERDAEMRVLGYRDEMRLAQGMHPRHLPEPIPGRRMLPAPQDFAKEDGR